MSRPTAATIHSDALRHNLARVRELAPSSRVLAVVKADGYGHGLERVARALEGADAFGVASLADAERIRAVGLSQRVVLLSGFDEPADLAQLARLGVDPVLHHDSQLAMLEAGPVSGALRPWIKLDTGMHRLGFAPQRAREVLERVRAIGITAPPVWMSHMARSDEFDDDATARQIERFGRAVEGLPGECSLANSAAVLGWSDSHRDWIRPGGALYGISVVEGRHGSDFGLEPAMSLGTRLIAINDVAAGEPVGYGGEFRCPVDMPVGIAAIGYGDGYPRHAASGTPVRVAGVEAPIIGRVSMDLLAIDLRQVPAAAVGSPVLLWGPGLPIERIATHAGTIGYELSCGLTRRVRFLEG